MAARPVVKQATVAKPAAAPTAGELVLVVQSEHNATSDSQALR